MKRSHFPRIGLLALLLTACMYGHVIAQFSRRICIEDLPGKILPPFERVPVGCEVIDCCPGCPGPGTVPLEVRIRLTTPPGISFAFQVENLNAGELAKLKLGKATLKDRSLIIGAGETIIGGFSPGEAKKLPVLRPTLLRDNAVADKDISGKAVTVNVEIWQKNYIVNDYQFVYELIRCGNGGVILPPPVDRIQLLSNTGNDRAVILADARRSGGCVSDEVHRTTNTVSVGNFLTNSGCNSEVAVFSDDNAMALVRPTTTWTTTRGDLLKVQLGAILRVPVTIWILSTDPNAQTRAQNDIDRASQLYNQEHAGVVFEPTFRNVSTNRDAQRVASTSFRCSVADRAALTGSAFFTPGRINAYYLNGAMPGARGINCTAADGRNIVFISTTADNESLAHEIGHSFSLGHTNEIAGIGSNNLMITGGSGRNNITEGQGFRVNVNATSTLNTNGVRSGTTRNCPESGTSTATCPATSLDIIPNN